MTRAPFHPVGGFGWALLQAGFALVMMLGHLDDYANLWVVLLMVPISSLATGIPLSARWHRHWIGKAAALLWLPLIGVVGAQLQPPLPEMSALWPAISAMLLLGLMALGGAPRVAWAIAVPVTAVGVLWGESRQVSLAAGMEQVALFTPLVAGTVYRWFMRRARARELVARAEEADAIRRLGVLSSQAAARREYRSWMLDQVGTLLDRLAYGEPLTAAERMECRLVEASLRDSIRGRGLATPEISQAARAARQRGATVTLIDDRHAECTDAVCRRVLGATRETLEQSGPGDTFVARLLPVGRHNVATVLLVTQEGEGVRREFALPPPGNPEDGALERPPVSRTA